MSKNYIGYVTTKAVIKYENGYILVRQEGEKRWMLPGGRLDFGETTDNCVLREVEEEVSLDCEIDRIISIDAYQGKEGKLPKLFIFYLLKIKGDKELKINNEIAEYVIVSKKDDLRNYEMYPNQSKVLEMFLD